MKSVCGMLILTGLVSLLCAIPAAAQFPASGVNFETSFSFYAGNAKMPAGKYRVTQPADDDSTLLIESPNGAYSVFLDCAPTSTETAHAQSDITFNKYGTTDFINMIWSQGSTSGMQVLPSKAEQRAAKKETLAKHSVPAK